VPTKVSFPPVPVNAGAISAPVVRVKVVPLTTAAIAVATEAATSDTADTAV